MRFELTAINGTGGIVRAAFDAPDEAAAREDARRNGLVVLSARRMRFAGIDLGGMFKAKFPLRLFSQELLALIDAGLSLPESLETLAEKESHPEQRRVLLQIRDLLFEGQSLSKALERMPNHFPPLFVSTVRAAERTGDLSEALRRYIDYEVRLDQVRKKVVSASIYPAVLVCVGGLVTLFLLGYVVPRFSGIYADSGRELPWLSKLLMAWGNLLNEHHAIVLGLLAAAMMLAALGFRRIVRVALASASHLPAVAERMLVYQLARFYRTVGMLLTGGTPLPQALDMVSGLLTPALRSRLVLAIRLIREGAAPSGALEKSGLTTPVAARMLRVGERGGNMSEMMERIAVFYDDDVARWIDWFTKLFEPLLMALIGIVIGVVVVLMYLPIFELAGSLQ